MAFFFVGNYVVKWEIERKKNLFQIHNFVVIINWKLRCRCRNDWRNFFWKPIWIHLDWFWTHKSCKSRFLNKSHSYRYQIDSIQCPNSECISKEEKNWENYIIYYCTQFDSFNDLKRMFKSFHQLAVYIGYNITIHTAHVCGYFLWK